MSDAPAILTALTLAVALGACAPHTAPEVAAPRAEGANYPAAGAGATEAAEPGAAPSATGAARAPQQNAPLPGGDSPTPEKALPELKLEPLGMHVGGGKNTPEEKAPFHRALERQYPAFMECYRLVEEPWAGGSFGIDIKVPRAGGAPAVEQPRTKIRGKGFEECMVAAFGKVQFEKPKAGPTVISYSVRFTLGPAKK